MRKEFEEEKRLYLEKIDEQHRKQAKKRPWWNQSGVEYNSTTYFAQRHIAKRQVPIAIDIKNSITGMIFIPVFFVVSASMGSIANDLKGLAAIVWGILHIAILIAVGSFARNQPGKKILLRFTPHGIWIKKEDYIVKWRFIVRSGIENDNSNDSNRTNLVLHFYDERYDCFREIEIETSDLAIGNNELCFYIEYFKTQHG